MFKKEMLDNYSVFKGVSAMFHLVQYTSINWTPVNSIHHKACMCLTLMVIPIATPLAVSVSQLSLGDNEYVEADVSSCRNA